MPKVFAICLDDARAVFPEFLRQAVLPYTRVLDEVIVDRHDLMVILKRHAISKLSGMAFAPSDLNYWLL